MQEIVSGVFTMTVKAIIYECGICGHCHPWNWNGDCRDDDNRFQDYEYAEHLGISESELDIRSWSDRCKADGLITTCKDRSE